MWITLLTLLLNMAISFVFGGSMSAMWTLLNTLQIVSFLPLLAVDIPLNAKILFARMMSTHGEVALIPNGFDYLMDSPDRTAKPLNANFNSYGFPTTNFLMLAGKKITLWVVLGVSFPFVIFMYKNYHHQHKICHVWKMLELKFKYSMVLRMFLISYLSFYISACLNVTSFSFKNFDDLTSSLGSLLGMVIFIIFPIHIFNFLTTHKKFLKNKEF